MASPIEASHISCFIDWKLWFVVPTILHHIIKQVTLNFCFDKRNSKSPIFSWKMWFLVSIILYCYWLFWKKQFFVHKKPFLT